MKVFLHSAIVIILLAALAVLDLGAGLTMMFAPNMLPQSIGVKPEDFAVPGSALWLGRAYGERLIVVGILVVALIFRGDRASLLWLPALDEALNAGLDLYELLSGTLVAAAVRPMLLVHAVFAVTLGLLWLVRPRKQAAAPAPAAQTPAMKPAEATGAPKLPSQSTPSSQPAAASEEADIEAMLQRTRKLTSEINQSEQ